MLGKSCVSAALLALAACAERQDDPERAAGHERMVALLVDVEARTLDENAWLGDYEVRALERRLAEMRDTPLLERIEVRSKLGIAYLRLGREKDAIEQLLEARRLAESTSIPADKRSNKRNDALFSLGVAYLRLGETQNCCERWTPDSCVLPIHGAGIHTRPEGSRGAVECFTKVAQATPPGSTRHLQAIWLLNIAAMTLNEHPDGVPEAFRIPLAAYESEETFPRFKSIAGGLGLDTFSQSGGAVADDFDNDGYLDLMVSTFDTAGQIRYFRNNADGTFADRTDQAGLRGILGGLNLVQADYDNDGNVDVLVLRGGWFGRAGRHPNSLLKNNGDNTFRDVTFESGLGEVHYPTQTAAWADYDNDGDLDLYIGNETSVDVHAPCQLFRNNGDGTFTDVAGAAGVAGIGFTKGVAWGDYDGDRRPDLYVSILGGSNRLYRNLGDGSFADIAERAGVTGPHDSFPVWFWDYDNDGALDLYVSNYSVSIAPLARVALGMPAGVELPRLYRGNGRGRFRDVAPAVGLARPAFPMGSNFGDLDNDGYLDFYLGTGAPGYWLLMPNIMVRNREGKRFVDVSAAGGFSHLQKGHAVAFADLDNDGDQDVFEQMGGAYPGDGFKDALYENPGFQNRWIGVHLVGTKTNRSAIGARLHVVVKEDGGTRSIYKHVNSGGSFGCNPLRQTIGLGRAEAIERLEVYWPTTGETQTIGDAPLDKYIRIVEGKEGFTRLDLRRLDLGSAAGR